MTYPYIPGLFLTFNELFFRLIVTCINFLLLWILCSSCILSYFFPFSYNSLYLFIFFFFLSLSLSLSFAFTLSLSLSFYSYQQISGCASSLWVFIYANIKTMLSLKAQHEHVSTHKWLIKNKNTQVIYTTDWHSNTLSIWPMQNVRIIFQENVWEILKIKHITNENKIKCPFKTTNKV